MEIMGTGLDLDGNPLIGSMNETDFVGKILGSYPHESIEPIADAGKSAERIYAEVIRPKVDLGDPRKAGWTFLVSSNDPQRDEIIAIMKSLAEHRKMLDSKSPLLYNGESFFEWDSWLKDNYLDPNVKSVPHYVLIIGGPDEVPFLFQSFLDIVASVGRVHFDSISDLSTYIEKLIRIENTPSPIVEREALFFATDGGLGDPTLYSRIHMAEPLAEHTRKELKINTKDLMKDNATKKQFMKAAKSMKPALVYTASHGIGAPKESFDTQKEYNGAICCQEFKSNPDTSNLFSANDVSFNKPIFEGSIFFQFACFGYGTPERSDYDYWFRNNVLISDEDFIAALPKKLLAHPRGPIGYIGHLDTAWLHAFADPDNPLILKRWHDRIYPFKKAVEDLLNTQPMGRAMNEMNQRYSIGNQVLANTGRLVGRGTPFTQEDEEKLVDTFIQRTDAQNYLIFGDPAVRLRIPV